MKWITRRRESASALFFPGRLSVAPHDCRSSTDRVNACAVAPLLRLSRANGRHDHWSSSAVYATPSRRDAGGVGGGASAKHASAPASTRGDFRHGVHRYADAVGAYAEERASRLAANRASLHTLARYRHATDCRRHHNEEARRRGVSARRSSYTGFETNVRSTGGHVPRSSAPQTRFPRGGGKRAGTIARARGERSSSAVLPRSWRKPIARR